jgi:hypothetical protein
MYTVLNMNIPTSGIQLTVKEKWCWLGTCVCPVSRFDLDKHTVKKRMRHSQVLQAELVIKKAASAKSANEPQSPMDRVIVI